MNLPVTRRTVDPGPRGAERGARPAVPSGRKPGECRQDRAARRCQKPWCASEPLRRPMTPAEHRPRQSPPARRPFPFASGASRRPSGASGAMNRWAPGTSWAARCLLAWIEGAKTGVKPPAAWMAAMSGARQVAPEQAMRPDVDASAPVAPRGDDEAPRSAPLDGPPDRRPVVLRWSKLEPSRTVAESEPNGSWWESTQALPSSPAFLPPADRAWLPARVGDGPVPPVAPAPSSCSLAPRSPARSRTPRTAPAG